MKKIALINQRYGKEVNGGSEYYTMQLAQHLKQRHEVEVLTTCALSYNTWENYYKDGEEYIDGIRVRRFPVKHGRRKLVMKITGKLITLFKMNYRWLNHIWIRAQGPYVPELADYIGDMKDEYDAFVFITYLYYPAVYGMERVKEKAVFVPTAHEEAYIHYKIMKDVFASPAAYVFLTEEEKELVHSLFPVANIPYEVAAMGIEPNCGRNDMDFVSKYDINGSYLIYAGRIDIDKGCGQLFKYFERYCRENPQYMLILMGKQEMELPESENIRYIGFVSEEDKNSGIAGAKALFLPSSHESLSIAALEAMCLGTPVIVNGESEVLKGHCRRSGGGMSYTDYEEFREAVMMLEDEMQYTRMAENAALYVERNYRWDTVILKWNRIVDEVSEDR